MRRPGQELRSNSAGEWDHSAGTSRFRLRMKTTPPLPSPILREDDIRAYAAHLFEQSGRIPNRDIENWLEAKACLEAHLGSRGPRRGRIAAPTPRTGPRGFTMPASDVALWID